MRVIYFAYAVRFLNIACLLLLCPTLAESSAPAPTTVMSPLTSVNASL